MKLGVNQLWPTTVIYNKIEDQEFLNDLVLDIFTHFDLDSPPSDFGNYSIFDHDSPVMERFKNEYVIPYFEQYMNQVFDMSLKDFEHFQMKAWLAGHSTGYSIASHNHSGAQLSAVFYPLVDDINSGHIIFTDPRGNANRGYITPIVQKEFPTVIHKPESGDAVVFPSFLFHHVDKYYGKMRICIPVDLYLMKNA